MSKHKCAECECDLKTHVKLCMKCMEDLKNDKYEDFAIVMATLNNAMHDLLKEKENLTSQVQDLQKENESLKRENISKIIDITNN